jgi:hypothetical protein
MLTLKFNKKNIEIDKFAILNERFIYRVSIVGGYVLNH